jgi:hypothetical protein
MHHRPITTSTAVVVKRRKKHKVLLLDEPQFLPFLLPENLFLLLLPLLQSAMKDLAVVDKSACLRSSPHNTKQRKALLCLPRPLLS